MRTCSICGETYTPPDTRCGCGEPYDREPEPLDAETVAHRQARYERDLIAAGRGHLLGRW